MCYLTLINTEPSSQSLGHCQERHSPSRGFKGLPGRRNQRLPSLGVPVGGPHQVTCRPFWCGWGIRKQRSRAPGTSCPQTSTPGSQPFPLTHTEVFCPPVWLGPFEAPTKSRILASVVWFFLSQCPHHTAIWPLSLSVQDRASAPWATFHSGAHSLS